MLFNLTSLLDWHVVTAREQRQVNIDNDREDFIRVSHEYAVDDLVYVEKTDIYCNIDNKNNGTNRNTGIFKNSTVRVQMGALNKQLNIRRIEPHFESV